LLGEEQLKNFELACAAFLVALIGGALPAGAQTPPGFDPAHPFANVTTPEAYAKFFIPGVPHIVPGDRFGNMTSNQFWQESWHGQNMGHPERTMAAQKGNGGRGTIIKSPYPYKTAEEHYDAWLATAHGGRKLTRDQLPDWSGDWQGDSLGVLEGAARISDVWDAVSDAYKPRFDDILRHEWTGNAWWPTAVCLPYGMGGFYFVGGANWHFMSDEHMVLINKDKNNEDTRYIYTDGRGFLPPGKAFPQWLGESQGFWDGDELVVLTKSIKRWSITHGLPEFSDKMEVVERFKRMNDKMLVDITLYDPEAFAFPWHDVAIFHLLKDWTSAPSTYQDCVSTNNVYFNKEGELTYHQPGEPGYLDFSDDRPWAAVYREFDAAHPDSPAAHAPAK
jgi:hypothetical protein